MNKIYNKLYSRTSAGSIQVWWTEQQEQYYRTVTGKDGGVMIESEWTECFGKNVGKKNETSAVDQCTKEIEALYTKKKKEGYHENIANVDNFVFFEPMLCKKWKADYVDKGKHKEGNLYGVQVKLNGMRCLAFKDGLFSRTGERILSCPHIEESLKPFFEKNPSAFLDGELYNYQYRQNLAEMMSVCRKEKPTQEHWNKSKEIVQYWIYDGCLNYDDLHIGYNERLLDLVPSLLNSGEIDSREDFIKVHKTTWTDKLEDVEGIFNQVIEDMEEGLIVRISPCPYEVGKRSKYLYKYKPEDDAEFEFIGASEGTGNWTGYAKIIHLKLDDGREFNGSFKGDFDSALYFLHNHKHLIGKKLTIDYMGKTAYGIPQSARLSLKNQKFDIYAK